VRVLVATTAGAGHLAGVLPFARAAAQAGHEVRVAAPGSFAPSVGGAGFVHEPLGDADPAELGAVFGRLPSLTRREADDVVVASVFGRINTAAALPAMREVVRRWRPHVVLREPAELSSYVAAQEAGIPHVQCNIGLDRLGERFLPALEEPLRQLGHDTGGLRGATRWTVVPPCFDTPAGEVPGSLTAAREPATGRAAGGLPDAWRGSTTRWCT
jgi:UDP:flavonoid glycosyltransferase YjiC (YdhE family)